MTIIKIKLAAVIAVALLLPVGATAVLLQENSASSPPATQAVANDIQTANQPAIARPNDLLSIEIPDLISKGSEFESRVDPQGMILVPYVDQLAVGGQSMSQIEATINTAFRNRGLIRDAKAHVIQIEDAAHASITFAPIAEGDHVRIRIWDLEENGKATAIEGAITHGSFVLPRVKSVSLVGQTEAQATRTIMDAYRAMQFLTNPIVEVLRVAPPTSRP